MAHLSKADSWLSLVAETAGVSGRAVWPVDLSLPLGAAASERLLRARVQIVTEWGQVVGSSELVAPVEDFWRGTKVEVGCDLVDAIGSHVVAWIEEAGAPSARPPLHASLVDFNPSRAMKLMLEAHPGAARESSFSDQAAA
jgi:hypothetical protein